MREPAELAVSGWRMSAATPIQLGTGWRWVGYLPRTSKQIAPALGSIDGKFDAVLGEEGAYLPPPALAFLNTLSGMEPGRGYLIRMTGNGVLVFRPGG